MPKGVYKRTEEYKKTLRKRLLGKNIGEKHGRWKGNKVGYRALHTWVQKQLGKPHFCEECGNKKLKHRQYNWANISGKYLRNLDDWRRLCAKCHKIYDITKQD